MLSARTHAWIVAPLCAASLAAAAPVPAASPAKDAPTHSPPVPADSPVNPRPVPAASPVDPQPVPTASPVKAAPTDSPPVPSASPANPQPVPADSQLPRLAVVRPVLVGFTNPALADQIAEQLVIAMRRGSAHVLALADVARVAPGPCEDSCLRGLRASLGADFVLRATISRVDRDHVVRLELLDARTRAPRVVRDATCELCGQDELRRFTADQVVHIVGAVGAASGPPPRLHLDSLPSGAAVYIDGRLLGMTPFDAEVPAGPHIIRLVYAGHVTEERALSASPGVHERVHVTLRRTPNTAAARRGGFALLFSGLAPAMAGLTLLGLDGRPIHTRCSGADVDAAGDCHYRFNTDWGGAGLLAVGALLTTAGILVLVRPRQQRTARLRAGLGGAGLVLRGSF